MVIVEYFSFDDRRFVETIALRKLHAAAISHGDIKPDNILLSGEEPSRIRFSDFGLSMVRPQYVGTKQGASIEMGETTRAAGTFCYAPPEILQCRLNGGYAKQITRSTDMYSFGLMLFAILTWGEPFESPDVRDKQKFTEDVVGGKRPDIRRLHHEGIPQALIEMITHCWCDQSDRWSAEKCCEVFATLDADRFVWQCKLPIKEWVDYEASICNALEEAYRRYLSDPQQRCFPFECKGNPYTALFTEMKQQRQGTVVPGFVSACFCC